MRILLFFIILICGCSKDIHNYNNTFIVGNGSEPETLDPALATSVNEMRIIRTLFDGLTELNPQNLAPQSGCATYEVSPDGLVYNFKLKPNLKWSDNSELTAYDFLYAWQRVLQRKVPAPYANFFFYIKNAQNYYEKKISNFDDVGIKIIDNSNIEITLTKPTAFFLELLSLPVFFPVKQSCIEKFGDTWTSPENIVSNGPFKVHTWLPRQRLEAKRFENYYDAKNVTLDSVIFYPYDNAETSYQLFLQGKIDWLPTLPIEKIMEIRYNPAYYFYPYMGVYFYRFNCSRPPFNNPLVRQAFSMAINRETITKQILGSGEMATSSFCPQVANYVPVAGFNYDLSKAKKLLSEAGYTSENFPPVEIFFNTSENNKKIAEAICAQWRENLNVNVSLRNTEWKTFLPMQNNLQYDISRSSWIGDYNDPETFFSIFTSENANNRCGFKNLKYDKLFAKSQQNISNEKRMQIFQQMEHILNIEEAPIAPLYYYMSHGLISQKIQNFFPNIQSIHPIKYIRKTP